MRMSKEELKKEYFSSWNDERHDIVAVNYGDDPLINWNKEEYEEYKKLTGTLANLKAVEAWIYTQNGGYSIYKTLIGDVYIKEDGTVLGGNINVKYGGKTYNLTLNQMYNKKSLDILRFSGSHVAGFSNKEGTGSPSRNTKELNKDTILKVLSLPLKDYGKSIQEFMKVARTLYNDDSTNYILDKCFSL